ncbi:Hypothetical_protein [Hexamita inflata]
MDPVDNICEETYKLRKDTNNQYQSCILTAYSEQFASLCEKKLDGQKIVYLDDQYNEQLQKIRVFAEIQSRNGNQQYQFGFKKGPEKDAFETQKSVSEDFIKKLDMK